MALSRNIQWVHFSIQFRKKTNHNLFFYYWNLVYDFWLHIVSHFVSRWQFLNGRSYFFIRTLNLLMKHWDFNETEQTECLHKGTHLVDIDRLLFGLDGLHLDILTELYRLLFCLYCRFPKLQRIRQQQNNVTGAISYTNIRSGCADFTFSNGPVLAQ